MRIVRMALIIVFLLSLSLFGATELVGLIGMDRTMPKISSDREVLEIPCEYTEEQLLEGLTASDGTDGDLTSQIIPGSFSRFIDEGVCNISYVVFDSSDHPASLTRQVRFTDYHPPSFTLTEPLVFAEQEGNYAEAMERLSASDQLDGNLEDWITQTDTDVNYQRAGSYTMTVEVELKEFTDDYARLQSLTKEITRQLRDEILITPQVRLVPKGSIAQGEGKAVRVRDLRKTLI